MKRILVTGVNTYVGASFENWLAQWPGRYQVARIDLRDENWTKENLGMYDVVYHLAAIVHTRTRPAREYFRINRDLAVSVAMKAKTEGVQQFIFASSMAVYGRATGTIDEHTEPTPRTPYGKSKLEAEILLSDLGQESFQVAIIRPPLVYGKNCPGNFAKLATLARRTPIVPGIENQRSMLFIDNFSEFARILVDRNSHGLFFPQNRDYVNTPQLLQLIANQHDRRPETISVPQPLFKLASVMVPSLNKVFGTLTYAKDMPGGPSKLDYQTCSFEQSVALSRSIY